MYTLGFPKEVIILRYVNIVFDNNYVPRLAINFYIFLFSTNIKRLFIYHNTHTIHEQIYGMATKRLPNIWLENDNEQYVARLLNKSFF